jgi:hypothetical protein
MSHSEGDRQGGEGISAEREMSTVLLNAAGDQHRSTSGQRLLGLGLGHVGEEQLFEVHRVPPPIQAAQTVVQPAA